MFRSSFHVFRNSKRQGEPKNEHEMNIQGMYTVQGYYNAIRVNHILLRAVNLQMRIICGGGDQKMTAKEMPRTFHIFPPGAT